MIQVVVNKQFAVQLRDVLKGLLLAVITPAFFVIQSSVDAGHLEVDWKVVGMTSLSAGLAYLGKQFFSAPKVITTYEKNAHAVDVANEIKYKIEYSGADEIYYVWDEKNNLVFTGTLNECDQWIASKK